MALKLPKITQKLPKIAEMAQKWPKMAQKLASAEKNSTDISAASATFCISGAERGILHLHIIRECPAANSQWRKVKQMQLASMV